MYQQMRKLAVKSRIITSLLLLLAGAVCLAITQFGIVEYLQGPIPVETTPYEELEGKYVIKMIYYPLEVYEEDYTLNEDTNEKRTTDYGYVVYDGKQDAFFGIIMDKDQEQKVLTTMEEAWAYLNYETDEDVAHPFTVSGTMKKMESDSLSYFNQTMQAMFSDYEYVTEAYYIESGTVAGEGITFVIIMTVVGAIFILCALWHILMIFTGSYKKGINKYLATHSFVAKERLTAEFEVAQKVNKRMWIGPEHTFAVDKHRTLILDNMDIIWAYYYSRSGRYHVSQIRLFDRYKKQSVVNLSRKEAMLALQFYSERMPHIVVGYDRELEKKFKNQMEAFLNLRYYPVRNQYQAQMQSQYDPYGNGAGNTYGNVWVDPNRN